MIRRKAPRGGPVGRRAALRGIGGVCLALPFLELFETPRARADVAKPPLRYVFGFGGASTGIEGQDRVVPAAPGPLAGQLTRALLPLGDLGIEDVTSIVTGLVIPYGPDGQIPAGGRRVQWHSSSMCPISCGMSSDPSGDEAPTGPTSDWVVADTLAGDTKHPVLTYRVQAASYRGSNGTGGTRGQISARVVNNNLEQVPPTISPQVAYQALFQGFVPPDPAEAEKAKFLLARRKSVVDLVGDDAEALLPRLGADDKKRMQRHFDELRALEKRLEALKLPDSPSCGLLADPGNDPPIGAAVENGLQGMGGEYDSTNAYSGEEERATVLVDLIHMAFACDLSRVANLMFTYGQCFLNMNPLYGYPSDLHEISHYSMGGGDAGATAMADCIGWHVKHWGRLIQKLKDTEDVDGTTLLDHTALILAFEGGWGYDPEQDGQGSAHSSENMVMLVGGKGGGLHKTPGQHIQSAGAHPVQVTNTVMKALGVPGELGEVTGTIDALLG